MPVHTGSSVSVVVPTYRRGHLLPYSLGSLAEQSRPPDEVVVVLKPSGDGSERVIEEFSDRGLPIRLVRQGAGFFVEAMELGIRASSGDLVLFLDDDAIAHGDFVARYVRLFRSLEGAGGIGGLVLEAYVDGKPVLSDRSMHRGEVTRDALHRRPLPEYMDYRRWLSVSGLGGSGPGSDRGVFKSALFSGANMAFKGELIRDLRLTEVIRGSRKGFYNEEILAYHVRRKGFHTYQVLDREIAPIVWHVQNVGSLTRSGGFWNDFWFQYDRASMYFRLRRMKAGVSPPAWIYANLAVIGRNPPSRALASLYALAYNVAHP